MSQSSETTSSPDTWTNPLGALGHKEVRIDGYYTARVDDQHGVCIATMLDRAGPHTFVQFFPWPSGPNAARNGHVAYHDFITTKAIIALDGGDEAGLLEQYPYLTTDDGRDILLLKCMVEEGRKQMEKWNDEHRDHAADPTTGETLE